MIQAVIRLGFPRSRVVFAIIRLMCNCIAVGNTTILETNYLSGHGPSKRPFVSQKRFSAHATQGQDYHF
jgi:hypothetical protein